MLHLQLQEFPEGSEFIWNGKSTSGGYDSEDLKDEDHFSVNKIKLKFYIVSHEQKITNTQHTINRFYVGEGWQQENQARLKVEP